MDKVELCTDMLEKIMNLHIKAGQCLLTESLKYVKMNHDINKSQKSKCMVFHVDASNREQTATLSDLELKISMLQKTIQEKVGKAFINRTKLKKQQANGQKRHIQIQHTAKSSLTSITQFDASLEERQSLKLIKPISFCDRAVQVNLAFEKTIPLT